ncbi:MAG: 2-C-methyl-D-erythritol 4-phosphate cytidylyltransferase [Actinomycetota bacterium]|nr:2-C-methyl-D-erythritol 4-phosphate cytidylyltransferase [Actinomycetota bacterium]
MWAIVVAAGVGSRFGGPKQYETLGDRRVLDWSLAAARSVADGVVLAVLPERAGVPEPAADVIVAGGTSRSESVRAALAAVPATADVVVVHDGARPLASVALFEAVVAAVQAGADGAVPGLPLADTVKRVFDGVVLATLDRAELVAVQTPQAFAAGPLRRAHSGSEAEAFWHAATDDAALVEALGGRVVVVPGEAANVKLTTPADLTTARRWLAR